MLEMLRSVTTLRERPDPAIAAALRRAAALERLLDAIRQETAAPRIMLALLENLMQAIGGRGAAVLAVNEPPRVLHGTGEPLGRDGEPLLDRLRSLGTEPQADRLPNGAQALSCPASTRFGDAVALCTWRTADEPRWTEDDRHVIAAFAGIVRIVLEHETIQRELARQARTDPLTGLLNRRTFHEDAGRRLDRIDREGKPATLILIGLDRMGALNQALGHDAGDAALVLTALLLRHTVRPLDLVARLGGDEFAIWMDGSDHLTAAERAEDLRRSFPAQIADLTDGAEQAMSMSVGIATRQPGSGEEFGQLMYRAAQAMQEVKNSGRGQWRVSNPGPGVGAPP